MASPLQKLLAFKLPTGKGIPSTPLYDEFHAIIERNNRFYELMADMGDKLGGEYVFDRQYILDMVRELEELVEGQLADYETLKRRGKDELGPAFSAVRERVRAEVAGRYRLPEGGLVEPLERLDEESRTLAGAKMASLAHLRKRLQLPVPDGFVITSRAFLDCLEKNGLLEKIRSFPRTGIDAAALEEASATMRREILAARLPRKLAREIFFQFDELAGRSARPDLHVCLRSSAWGENGRDSFAGQYATLLNVGRGDLVESYLQVLASAYAPGAWHYRLEKGYREHEIAMAVGCQVMVESEVSGNLHTCAPHIAPDCLVINAVWGLGEPVASGTQAADTYVVSRTPPHTLRDSEVAAKPQRLVAAGKTGVKLAETPARLVGAACLSVRQLAQLAEAAMRIEQYHKRPQEIEWAFDRAGNLQILQLRPLRFFGRQKAPGKELEQALRRATVVFSGKGFAAQCGIGVGRVYKITEVAENGDLADFPAGGILVARYGSPKYAEIMHKARGIITDIGSPTGHMATLAREFRVPTIVNAGVASSLLQSGDEITLDAAGRTVYRGFLYDLDRFELTEEEVFEDTYEYRLLRRLNRHVSRLNLVNSKSADFTPANCRTYHDIIRYVRARAGQAFIRLSEQARVKNMSAPRRLLTEIPLGLQVIDAGGGTDCPAGERTIRLEQITSLPLRCLLEGMLAPGAWCTAPVSVDLGSFMSSFTRTFCASLSSPQEVGRNLAVVLKNYMDISLRLGYHFTVMDAYFAEEADDNSINFRFFGGVTEFSRRSRRAAFISRVLEHFDFLVEVHGDLVAARLKKLSLARMSQRMRMLGGLVGYTRQLDTAMDSEDDIARHADIFVKASNCISGG